MSYWRQARRFAEASYGMPTEAAPLTIYYAFLNATKALLTCKGASHADYHGVGGERPENARASLSNETVTLQNGGILPALCRHLGDNAPKASYSLSNILWNIPFIHRAYTLTYKKGELFIPLEKARYVRKEKSSEAWFEAEVIPRFSDRRKLNSIPTSFEHFEREGKTYVRRKKRFSWYIGRSNAEKLASATERLTHYHSSTRRVVVNINGNRDLWYLKRINPTNDLAEKHTIILILAAMHRLSELSRYDPNGLDKHLAGRANWLLSEFIHGAMHQFIDQIATEITGCQFWPPKTR